MKAILSQKTIEELDYESKSLIAVWNAERTLKMLKICKDCAGGFLPKISNVRCVDCYEEWVIKAKVYEKDIQKVV